MNMASRTYSLNAYAPRQLRCTPEVNPHTVSQIHQQLLLIFHASECRLLEMESNAQGQQYACDYPSCTATRFVLNHMDGCDKGKTCKVPHCSTTRQHLNHWNYCKKNACPACSPLRAKPAQQGVLNQWYRPQQQRQQRFGAAAQAAKPVSFADDTRNWRLDISHEQRDLFVYKLIHEAFHFAEPQALFHDKLETIEDFARKLEDDMFQRANSRSEYVEMMSQRLAQLKAEFAAMNAARPRGLLPTPPASPRFY